MKRLIVLAGALAVLNGLGAEKPESPFKAMDEARAAFNKAEGGVFKDCKAADYRTLPAEARPDAAPGAAEWVVALPLKNDARVRFIRAEFKDGRFVRGEMRRLGLKPEKLDAAAFAALRQESAMLAVPAEPAGTAATERVCAFYPAGKVADTQQNDLPTFGRNMGVNPTGRYVNGLCGIAKPLGVDVKGLKYAYTLTTPAGDVLDMGQTGDSRNMRLLMREQLEALHPKMKGRYSDRDLVDFYCKALITYRPAENGNAKK